MKEPWDVSWGIEDIFQSNIYLFLKEVFDCWNIVIFLAFGYFFPVILFRFTIFYDIMSGLPQLTERVKIKENVLDDLPESQSETNSFIA